MKKIVGKIAAVALAAGVAFADVGIGSWGRAIFAPVAALDGGDVKALETTSWMSGLGTSRIGISVHGESENVGFNIDMNADQYGKVGIHDTAYFWAKPWSWLEVKIGKVQDDTGRGNACFGLFNWIRMGGGWNGEDYTFTRFGDTNGFTHGGQARGAIVKVTPVKGLWIIGAFDLGWNKTKDDDGNDTDKNANDITADIVFGQKSSYGVGYDIDGIGSIRAKYIGGANSTDKDGNAVCGGQVNAAFDLTAVENLYVTIGAFIPFDLASTSNKQVTLAAYANYKVSIVTIHAIFHYSFEKVYDDLTRAKADSMVGVGADFDLGNGIGINADVRYSFAKKDESNSDNLAFLVGLSKGLTNGMIGVGFEGQTNAKGDKFGWAVPVVISAWF
ncbi:MAG: hypothetical protein ACI4LX_10950 [Treponema sp.]